MSVSFSRIGDVWVLQLANDDNRLTTGLLDAVDKALDQVTAEPAPLVTIGEGKFYSNGLDLAEIMTEPEQALAYTARVRALLATVLTLPVPTIAAVNGHAFGAGAMFALAHDFRLMNAVKGFFCFPEIDIKIPFMPAMTSLIQSKLSPATAVEAMTTGRRYGGPDAAARGLVDQAVAPKGLLDAAVALAEPLAIKDPGTLGSIKATMFAAQAAALRS